MAGAESKGVGGRWETGQRGKCPAHCEDAAAPEGMETPGQLWTAIGCFSKGYS